jgi:hypothetical protein
VSRSRSLAARCTSVGEDDLRTVLAQGVQEPDREWVFTVPFEFRHWIRGTAYRYAETTITVE